MAYGIIKVCCECCHGNGMYILEVTREKEEEWDEEEDDWVESEEEWDEVHLTDRKDEALRFDTKDEATAFLGTFEGGNNPPGIIGGEYWEVVRL